MTVKKIAELAGVSPATVSLVLNGKKGVSLEKRQEILRIVEEMNYKHQKKGGSTSKSILFLKYSKHGLLVEENIGFISVIMDAAEQECKKQNLNFSITTSKGRLEEILNEVDYAHFSGLIVLGTEIEERDYPILSNIPIPYVIVDNSMPNFETNCVAIDNKENVFKAIEYFAQQGFTEVGYFKSDGKVQNFVEREQGFMEAVAQFNMKVDPSNIFEVPPTMLGAFELTQKYIEEGAHIPRCLFIDNDTIAIGVMKALKLAGFDIPNDISVIGFDDIPFAKIHSPTISTMSVNKHLLGEVALSLLQEVVKNENYRNVKVRIGGELVKRQSTI